MPSNQLIADHSRDCIERKVDQCKRQRHTCKPLRTALDQQGQTVKSAREQAARIHKALDIGRH